MPRFGSDKFQHYAFYNEEFGRIEMHLVSLVDQTVQLNGTPFSCGQGEHIVTEYSYKYTVGSLPNLRPVRDGPSKGSGPTQRGCSACSIWQCV